MNIKDRLDQLASSHTEVTIDAVSVAGSFKTVLTANTDGTFRVSGENVVLFFDAAVVEKIITQESPEGTYYNIRLAKPRPVFGEDMVTCDYIGGVWTRFFRPTNHVTRNQKEV